MTANINKQLMKLVREEGLTMEQACASLGLSPEAGQMAVMSVQNTNQSVDLGDLIEKFKPEAVSILMDIARCSERDADRVKACQILLEGKGVMPEVNAAAASDLFNRFEAMRSRVAELKAKPAKVIEEKPIIEVGGSGDLAFGK